MTGEERRGQEGTGGARRASYSNFVPGRSGVTFMPVNISDRDTGPHQPLPPTPPQTSPDSPGNK